MALASLAALRVARAHPPVSPLDSTPGRPQAEEPTLRPALRSLVFGWGLVLGEHPAAGALAGGGAQVQLPGHGHHQGIHITDHKRKTIHPTNQRPFWCTRQVVICAPQSLGIPLC